MDGGTDANKTRTERLGSRSWIQSPLSFCCTNACRSGLSVCVCERALERGLGLGVALQRLQRNAVAHQPYAVVRGQVAARSGNGRRLRRCDSGVATMPPGTPGNRPAHSAYGRPFSSVAVASATAPRSTCKRASSIAKPVWSGLLFSLFLQYALRFRAALLFHQQRDQCLPRRIMAGIQAQCRLVSRQRIGNPSLLHQRDRPAEFRIGQLGWADLFHR